MYDFNDVSIKPPAHFTNDLRCVLFICFSGSYGLLLGAIIMMGYEVEGVNRKRIWGKKVITYRLDKLISNDIHLFCVTAAKTHSRMVEE